MFPTRHWSKLQFTLPGATFIAVDHGLRDGRNGTAITPDAVEFEMGVANYNTWANQSIGKVAPDDATHIYLYNFDQQTPHAFSIVARSFYSDDDVNF